MESNQYFPLTAFSPSLALISLQVSAGSSGIVPRETKPKSVSLSVNLCNLCQIIIFNDSSDMTMTSLIIKQETGTIRHLGSTILNY